MGAQLPLYNLKSFLGKKKLKNLTLVLTKKWSTYFSTRQRLSRTILKLTYGRIIVGNYSEININLAKEKFMNLVFIQVTNDCKVL